MYVQSAYNRSFPSIYRGVVEDNKDPQNLGRCKIRVPAVYGELNYPVTMLPWSRPIVLSPVNKDRGSVNIPDVGDIVWVMFEGANREHPIYFGGSYAVGDIPASPTIVDIYVDQDSKLSYDRVRKAYILSVGENSILIENNGISLTGDTRIQGNLSVSGNLTVSGVTTLSNLIILGSCNKECDCP